MNQDLFWFCEGAPMLAITLCERRISPPHTAPPKPEPKKKGRLKKKGRKERKKHE
jgi:hypothetical protein